jgi:hypothetical protein
MSVDIKTVPNGALYPLSGIVTVSLAATGQTTLYTVPTGFTAVIDHVDIILGADASTSAITIGRSTALTDFLNTQTLSSLDADGDVGRLMPIPNATTVLQKSYAAGVIIQVDVTTGNGGATNYMILWGYLATEGTI